jgi:hypothetical protein
MAPNAGKHNIYIIEVGGEFRVRPAVAMVEGSKAGVDKDLSIRNTTDYPAIVVFKSGFTKNSDVVELMPKQKPPVVGQDVKIVQLSHLNDEGHYFYDVMIRKGVDLIQAIGESKPSVIVDP